MAARELPPAEVLRQLFRYEPDTGKVFWREKLADPNAPLNPKAEARRKQFNTRYAGKEAFACTRADKGYKVTRFMGCVYPAHRVIWKMQTGKDPVHVVDHINGDTGDNRWSNLREADHSQNRMNGQKIWSASGRKGVYYHPQIKRWTSRIQAYGKDHYLGCFQTADEASAAYQAAARVLFGEFANLKLASGRSASA